MVVVKGNEIGEEVDETISSSAVVPLAVTLDRIVAKVVAATVTKVDRVVSIENGKRVDEAIEVVFSLIGAIVVVAKVDVIVLIAAAVVVFNGASVAMNGNFGHGFIICGPSIESNT